MKNWIASVMDSQLRRVLVKSGVYPPEIANSVKLRWLGLEQDKLHTGPSLGSPMIRATVYILAPGDKG